MKSSLKRVVRGIMKSLVPRSMRMSLRTRQRMLHQHEDSVRKLLRYKVILAKDTNRDCADYVRQMGEIFKRSSVRVDGHFIYPLDTRIARMIPEGKSIICSITPDFGKIIETDLSSLEKELKRCTNVEFRENETNMIRVIYDLRDRVISLVERSAVPRKGFFLDYLPRMLDVKPSSFEEALQKILFYNALFWQANHWHIGLGRLDRILYPYYQADMDKGTLDRERAMRLLKEFCVTLNRDMRAKSMSLFGDTGQYILLGGVDDDGQTIQNDLTAMLIEIVGEMRLPDPKLILRVNDQTSSAIWQKSIACILTGCGSPLVMNEGLVMERMREFGYSPDHVAQVGTSACWEPLIIGKSFDQNNPLPSVVAVKYLNDLLSSGMDYADFASLYQDYKQSLRLAIHATAHDIAFDCSPLLSLFMDDCLEKERDYTQGGAVYAYHGMQVVSFPNTINSLLNVKRFVYDERLFTLSECREAIRNNYEGHEDMRRVFEGNERCFGSDDSEAKALANDLLDCIGEAASELRVNGERVKIGISSPAYVNGGMNVLATLDGRKAGMPLAVHISPVSERVGIKEILDFASSLRYSGNRINGNVVDFILPVAFAREPQKLEILLRDGIRKGVFELQLNVLNAEILKDAKIHPERHKDLIVRVWGFSAYFNDLPDSYKDNLIKRAEMYGA